tara:strand:+ start:369 stop:836 length:468 start_codon:yes stop_codon:yes gene_type:complete
LKGKVTTNFRAKTVNQAVTDETVNVINFIASAVTGARLKGKGSAPDKTVGIKSMFTHDSSIGRPSKAGTPPGVLTGTLRRSFTTKAARKMGKRVIAQGGTNVLYARIHEFGLGRHPRRPFMEAGIDSARGVITNRIGRMGKRIKITLQKRKGPMQ